MTYKTVEESIQDGEPVELYEFAQGITRWSYSSGVGEFEFTGLIYRGTSIVRDRIKQSGDVFKDGIKITLPRDNQLAARLLTYESENVTTLTIRRVHQMDSDLGAVTLWKGRVVGSKANGNTIELTCESVYTSMKRQGLRATFELNCRHRHYGPGCNVNREAYKVSTVVNTVSSPTKLIISDVAGNPNGHFTGGVVEFANGASRFIVSHFGDTIELSYSIGFAAGGMAVNVYPGCDRTTATCRDKFDNLINHGGFPFIPIRNPFNGSSIV